MKELALITFGFGMLIICYWIVTGEIKNKKENK
jgi:hypothetical protein